MEKPLVILCDLDNTLIDTERIKREIFYDIGVEYGLTLDEVKEIYQSIRNIDGKVTLTPRSFAHALSQKTVMSDQAIEVLMYEKLKELGSNLCIDGAVELLEGLEKKNLERYVMTLGVHSWQEEKIEYTGIGRYFPKEKKILPALDLLEKEAKYIALKNFFGEDIYEKQFILFNDKPDETARLLEKFENIYAFVRHDIQDKRFQRSDFEKCKSIFGERFLFSESLFELKDKFEYFLKHEYGQE